MRGRAVVVALLGALALGAVVAAWRLAPPPGWTQEMRDAFLLSCATSNRGGRPEDVKHYCECTLQRLETSMPLDEYRREEAAMARGGFKPTARMTEIILGCIGVDPAAAHADPALAWTADDQRQFLVNCIGAARASLRANAKPLEPAVPYCRCVLAAAAKRMTADEYRTLERASAAPPTAGPLGEIATACAGSL